MTLFGAFKSSCTALVGVLWQVSISLLGMALTCVHGCFCRKVPFRLSRTKKAGIRKRLRMVEDNINELNESGIHIKALASDGVA